jgi:hypothetical protein
MQENVDISSSSSILPLTKEDSKIDASPLTEKPEVPVSKDNNLLLDIPPGETDLSISPKLKEVNETSLARVNHDVLTKVNNSIGIIVNTEPFFDSRPAIASFIRQHCYTSKYLISDLVGSQLNQSIIQAASAVANIRVPNTTLEAISKSLDFSGLDSVLKVIGNQQSALLTSITKQIDSQTAVWTQLREQQNEAWISIAQKMNLQQNELLNSLARISTQIMESWSGISSLAVRIALDPLLDDLIQAAKGDADAAGRLAARIRWRPDKMLRLIIQLKARISGCSSEEVRIQALTQGVLRVLSYKENVQLPVLLQPGSEWALDNEKNIITICPEELTPREYWDWLQEEAARAAGLLLTGQVYAPSFVVIEPPDEDYNLQLAQFTSSSENYRLDGYRGRPVGSGTFENRDAFLNQVSLAAVQIRRRGNKVTQERVAETLVENGMSGPGNPVFQLQRWTREFGYSNWSDLLSNI